MNGHITSTIHSKRKIREQLLFSIDIVCQTVGNLADRLIGVENEATFLFIAPLCTSFAHQRKNVTLILPGIYSVGKLQSCKLVQNEIYALQKLTTVTNDDMLTFNKLYCKETMLYSTCYGAKRDRCRPCFQSYADADMLSLFIVQVFQ